MTFLPIVERELRIVSRRAVTYWNRTAAAGLVMLIALVMLMFGALTSSRSEVGVYMFHTLSFLTMLFCMVEGARKTADSLSEEKREGTLGLLFLTDLKGYDVVLGKLAGASLSSVYGLFAILPVLSLPIMVGGVTPGEYWRMVLALANILFFSLSTGMLVSAWCRREDRAMGSTLLLVLAFMFAPEFLPAPFVARLSPWDVYSHAFALTYLHEAREYWLSLGVTQGLSWLMLASASVMLPHVWQDAPAKEDRRLRRRKTSNGERYESQRRDMLAANPAYWLASHQSRGQASPWILIAVAAAGGLFYFLSHHVFSLIAAVVIIWLVNFTLKMRVATQACHGLAEARRNNALEMLLATPLTVNEILNGQILALQNRFLGPIIILIAVESITIFAGVAAEASRGDFAPAAALMVCVIYFALFFLDLVAVTWVGMWQGLTAKKETQAVIKTILLVLVLPGASFGICWFGVVLYIGIPIFWIAWCSSKLRAEFRTLAAQRYAPPRSSSDWIAVTNQPPIIDRHHP